MNEKKEILENVIENEENTYIEIDLMAYRGEDDIHRLQISKLFNPNGLDLIRISITNGEKILEFVDLGTETASQISYIIKKTVENSIIEKLEILETKAILPLQKNSNKDTI